MEHSANINCPHCLKSIDISDVLTKQIREGVIKQVNTEQQQMQQHLLLKEEQFKKAKEAFELKKAKENELFNEKLEAKLKQEKITTELKIKKEIEDQYKLNQEQTQKELLEKSEKLKELYNLQAQNGRLVREKNEMKEALELENIKKINEALALEKERIKKQESEKYELQILEYKKQVDDQKKLTEEMRRKQEQGSMQLQGEVMELAIESYLKQQFPLDEITEIKKGAKGADCIQQVNTREKLNVGTIYYESKRTKAFEPSWIEKFKTDIKSINANVGVLVTEVLPKNMERMGYHQGIWICTFDEFKGLCFVLRESLIQINEVIIKQENKGDKMELLYNYLSSNIFKQQIEAIVEGFTQMKKDLDSEKRALQKIWKQREIQIEKVTLNTIDMHTSIRGIAGSAITPVSLLELPTNLEE